MTDENRPKTDQADEFARQAKKGQHGVLREIVGLLHSNRKWWLAPIIVALMLAGVIVLLGGTAVGPVLYTLF